MEQKLTIIDKPAAIDGLLEYLADKDLVAYDTETTGVGKDAEIIGFSVCAEESEAFYVILSGWDPSKNELAPFVPKVAVLPVIRLLQTKSLVMHNAVFDCSITESFFNVKLIDSLHTDTMILAHLLNENRKVGLKELGQELFGESAAKEQAEMKESALKNGAKLTKASYEMYKADPFLLAKYGAKDALLTYRLFHAMVPDLVEQELDSFFYHDESMPLLKGPTYDLNTTGLRLDQEAMTRLKKTLEAECLQAKDFIYSEIKPYVAKRYPGTSKKTEFNIGSSSQLAWLVFGQLKLEFATLTKEGKTVCKALGLRLPYHKAAKNDFIETCLRSVGSVYSPEATVNGKKVRAKKVKEPWAYIACDKATLKKHASRYEWIQKLLEYQAKMKILSTYVEGLEERVRYGVIHPSFLQHGTTSGRYSSRNPNFQNLPRDDKRVKACIVARPGKAYVGADYSQLEPRVFAYVSQDPNLMAAFNNKDVDFYSLIGMEVYGKTDCTPQKDGSPDAFGVKYKKLRDLSKVITLASVYGATSFRLASATGKSVEETQEDINAYFEQFPKVRQMMLDSHKMAKSQGFVTNLFGRKRRLPEAKNFAKYYGKASHDELPYEARKTLNLSCNHRIQSTGASIVNRAAIKFYNNLKKAGISAKLVVQVHDSLVAECDENDSESVAILLQDAMETAVELPGVPLEAIPKIGKTLADV